ETGQPLRPAIIWLDQRHAEVDGPVKGIWGPVLKVMRAEDTVMRFREKAQANWIAQNQPTVWANTHKYLLLSGYLNYQLTGEYRDSTGSQVGYRSEEHTSELQSRENLVCRLLLEKKKKIT